MTDLPGVARWSLAILWLFTALTSAILSPDTGLQILASAGVDNPIAEVLMYAGSGWDLLLGVWLVVPFKRRLCYQLQLLTITLYSVLLTVLAPAFWLHPFGPVTKNLPLIVLILMLMSSDPESRVRQRL